MLTIAMKSNVLHIFTACEYYHMCVDELLIWFVSSVESLLAVLCPTPVLQFFLSQLWCSIIPSKIVYLKLTQAI